ncbi:hypothetical protein [Rhizohabitans arisaemae]|uniref:hypothetical protein n=1 Tax=Rhizohabitans arisaemae TaxID=2720610 RepID=UPI0024B181AE|nr:hypothetical protein [Rhizohabitans arisaemae]
MKFVSRRDWGARPLVSPASRNITPAQGGVSIHWEGSKLGEYAHDVCDDRVRGIQRFHIDRRGWADVAYTALVCRHGFVYEGRWIGRRTAANGTNTGNDGWYAVCAIMGQGDKATPEMKSGIKAAVEHLWAKGARRRVNGHRDHLATDCPGNELYTWLRAGMPVGGEPEPPAVEQPLKRMCVLGSREGERQTVAAGAAESVRFAVEFVDPDDLHEAEGASVVPRAAGEYVLWARATLDGLRRGDRVRLRFSRHAADRGFVSEIHGEDRLGHGRALDTSLHTIDRLVPADRLHFQIVNPNDYPVTVVSSEFRLAR